MTRNSELEIVAKFLEMDTAELIGIDAIVLVVMVAEKCVKAVATESGRIDMLATSFGLALTAQSAKSNDTDRRLQRLTDKVLANLSREDARRLIEGLK